MRSNTQAVEDAWSFVVAEAKPQAVMLLTGVSAILLKRMRAALKKLTKHAPECTAARMTWKEAAHAAAAVQPQREHVRKLADTIRKALNSNPVPVSVLAEALSMTDATLPDALMNTWANSTATRGVRHDDQTVRA